jgi:hypothetical protein
MVKAQKGFRSILQVQSIISVKIEREPVDRQGSYIELLMDWLELQLQMVS